MTALIMVPRKNRRAAFTLVELLTVVAIIAVLAALTLSAGSAVMNKAARNRAASEIQAMSGGLEAYKTDNGIYPAASNLVTTTYTGNDGSLTAGLYQLSSRILYKALASKIAYTDVALSTVSPATGTAYTSFKLTQIGSPTANSYMKDPWNYSYGYSTGDANTPQNTPPYNGTGFFDLWSTGGLLKAKVIANPALVSAWVSNWQ